MPSLQILVRAAAAVVVVVLLLISSVTSLPSKLLPAKIVKAPTSLGNPQLKRVGKIFNVLNLMFNFGVSEQ